MKRLALFLARFGCVPACLAPAKPRVRINQNGWVRHDGSPFPFPGRTPVEVVFLGVNTVAQVEYAAKWPDSWWRNDADNWRYNIRWYRIVADPVPPIGGRL